MHIPLHNWFWSHANERARWVLLDALLFDGVMEIVRNGLFWFVRDDFGIKDESSDFWEHV